MSSLTSVLQRRSLRGRFLAITVPLVLVATFTLFSLFELETYQTAVKNLRQAHTDLLHVQSAALANPLWNVDKVQVDLTLAAIKSNPDVLGVEVFDETGAVFDSVGRMEGESGSTIVGEQEIVFGGDDRKRSIGRLRVAVTDARVLGATLVRMLLAGGMAFLVVVSVVIAAIVGHRRTIGVPLERLLASIRLAQQSGERVRVDWQSPDEIGTVVSAFNEMQGKQEANEAALRNARDTLEQRVEERTAELAAAHARTQMAQAQLTEALQSIGQGFALYDSDDRLVLCNQNYREQLYPGMEAGIQVGSPFEEILRHALKLGLIEDAKNSEEKWLQERLDRRRNPVSAHQQLRSSGRWIEITERRTEDGGTVSVYTDITGLKRREQELADLVEKVGAARDEAQAANEAKSAFLAMMSHEIRTPMNAIIGMTSLLLNTELTPDQKEFSETVRHSGESLLTIINDILDFSKIDAGRMDIEEQPFDLRECLDNSLDLLAGKAVEKGLELACLVEGDTPAGIRGDVTRLRQILINLLSNSIKFTEHGEVVLSVVSRPVVENGEGSLLELHFSVRDTGIGIPADRMDRLFRSFSQVDASTSRRYGGTGLGLVISKRLSELMGGAMWVESTPGKGTTFHFTIRAEATPVPSRDYLKDVHPELEGKRVLIVDDNATNRRILEMQTTVWGMQPVEASSAREALSVIRSGERLDMGILDMQMPDIDGAALAAAIRKERTEDELPLVLLSSLGSDFVTPEPGLFAVSLTKPAKPSQLHNSILGVLVKERDPNVGAELANDREFDADMAVRLPLRILLTEDNTINQKLALRLLEQLGYRADVAGNGLEALEALERQAYDIVLMDVQMPEMDGLEATRCIREKWPVGSGPRIVAMTANAMPGDREISLAAGMDDYISKPIRVKELIGALSAAGPKAGGRAEKGAGAQAAALDQDGPVDSGAVSDQALEALRELVGGQEYLVEMIDAFLDDAPQLVTELREAYEQDDAATVTRAAHTLKSNGTDFGALALSDLCREIEGMSRTGSLTEVASLVHAVETEFEQVKTALARSIGR